MLDIHSHTGPAQPGEGVFADGAPIGPISSAVWGCRTGRNLAMAYVDPAHAQVGSKVEILSMGVQVGAAISELCLYDPENTLPRGAS